MPHGCLGAMYHSNRQKRPWLLLIHHPLKNIKKTLLSSHVGVLLGQSAPQHTSQYFVKNSDAIGLLRRPEVLASLEFHSESRGQFSLPRFLLLVPQTQFQTQALLPPSLCALPLILSFHHCPLPSPFHSSSCSHVNSHQSSLNSPPLYRAIEQFILYTSSFHTDTWLPEKRIINLQPFRGSMGCPGLGLRMG